MRESSLIASFLLLASFAPACADGRQIKTEYEAVEAVQAAIEKGHGAECSLSGEVVSTGGYFHCLDVGPYRFVSEYGRTRAFVIVDKQPPFAIMTTENGEPEFLVKGPWQTDLTTRVAKWWSDEIEGGRIDRETQEATSQRQMDAERAVRRFTSPDSEPITSEPSNPNLITPSTPADPAAIQPQATDTAPAVSRPLPAGAKQIAPGVVEIPTDGLPQKTRGQ